MEEKNKNIIVAPTFPNSNINGNSMINKSSMITYSKIVCCMCGALIEANPRGICDACERKNIDIISGVRTEYILQYCRTCDRYFLA